MKVLVACEFSGIVRDAFAAIGHDAWSCDLLPTEKKGNHIQGNVLEVLDQGWDLMIAHPPCTHLSTSGARWFPEKIADGRQQAALDFFCMMLNAPINLICVENPVSIASSRIRRCTQVIHPWQFGHSEEKTTCLWLKNLPRLRPTLVVEGRENRLHQLPPSENRWMERSRTFTGIAEAMAIQWGRLNPRRKSIRRGFVKVSARVKPEGKR